MKRRDITLAALATTGLFALGGCSSFSPFSSSNSEDKNFDAETASMNDDSQSSSMASFDEESAFERPLPRYTPLGSSDSLGGRVITQPAAVARAEELRAAEDAAFAEVPTDN